MLSGASESRRNNFRVRVCVCGTQDLQLGTRVWISHCSSLSFPCSVSLRLCAVLIFIVLSSTTKQLQILKPAVVAVVLFSAPFAFCSVLPVKQCECVWVCVRVWVSLYERLHQVVNLAISTPLWVGNLTHSAGPGWARCAPADKFARN